MPVDDKGDCELCFGAGEVSISKDGTHEGTDSYGCPLCMSREHAEEVRELQAQIDRLKRGE